jgi:type IV pilus assembly protein PilO
VIPVRRVLQEKRRIVSLLFVVLLANLALYAVAVYPLSRKVSGAEARADVARTARAAADREQAVARATLEGKDRADRELRKFYAEVLPGGHAAARRITYLRLARLAREAGLEPGRTGFDAIPVRNSSLTRLAVSLDLQGSYGDIRRFIYLLETAPEFTIIENVTLASAEGGELQLTLALATYYRDAGHGD